LALPFVGGEPELDAVCGDDRGRLTLRVDARIAGWRPHLGDQDVTSPYPVCCKLPRLLVGHELSSWRAELPAPDVAHEHERDARRAVVTDFQATAERADGQRVAIRGREFDRRRPDP